MVSDGLAQKVYGLSCSLIKKKPISELKKLISAFNILLQGIYEDKFFCTKRIIMNKIKLTFSSSTTLTAVVSSTSWVGYIAAYKL